MGCLKDPNYVREFTYRTKYNYYKNMYEHSDQNDQKTDYYKKLKDVEERMKMEGYKIEEYFEVTDLLNSLNLIGDLH